MIGMMSVIIAAILLIILGYLAVGFSGYLAFPKNAASNTLNNFSGDDVLMQVQWANNKFMKFLNPPIFIQDDKFCPSDIILVSLSLKTIFKEHCIFHASLIS